MGRLARGRGRRWGPGGRRGPRRGFGCLFGLVFLRRRRVARGHDRVVLSQFGGLPGFIALLVVVGS